MKQYAVFFDGIAIEYTGYFKSVSDIRSYLKSRYKDNGAGLTFQAVYPQVEKKIYYV